MNEVNIAVSRHVKGDPKKEMQELEPCAGRVTGTPTFAGGGGNPENYARGCATAAG